MPNQFSGDLVKYISTFLIGGLLLLVGLGPFAILEVSGQTSVSHPPIITAIVPDNIPPTAPILVAPEDNSVINTATPSFVWYYSTDNVAMSHYQLIINGNLVFNNIPLTNTDNSFYTLTYDTNTNYYTLTPKNGLSDGTHTWKITAVDTSGNSTDSVTWSFTIDTLAPAFVITQIGSVSTSISAQDSSTVPTNPIVLDANQPLLRGTGEPNSNVTLTITIPSSSQQILNFVIDGSGNWSQQLGILPRDVIITLDFIIIDLAGNVSTLAGVQFIIPREFIIFPPPPSPLVSPSPIISPTPPVTPLPPEFSPPPSPTIEEPLPSPTPEPAPIFPVIRIPIIPPDEFLFEIVESLPAPIATLIRELPEIIRTTIEQSVDTFGPIGSLVVTLAMPGLGLIALLWELGRNLSGKLLLRILQAIGLLPPKNPQGLVYNSENGQPIAFALLTIKNANPSSENQLWETVITDTSGIYAGIELPADEYIMEVSHQDYRFPTQKQRPGYLSFREFYRGEVFKTNKEVTDAIFLVPLDPLERTGKRKIWYLQLRHWLARVRMKDLAVPLFIITVIIAIVFPSLINTIVVGLYIFMFIYRGIKSLRKPPLYGTVVDRNETPIANAIIRLSEADSNQTKVLTTTDDLGRFSAQIKPNIYQLSLVKNDYIWVDEGQQINIQEIVLTGSPRHFKFYMRDIKELINLNENIQ